MAMGLLASRKSEKKPGSVLLWNSLPQIKLDTTGIISLLEVDSFNLPILPPSCGVQFYKDGIVFLSMSKNEGKMLSGHISFGTTEAYSAVLEDSALGKHKIFSPSASFSYPCEAITFSPDFNTMYFTKLHQKDNREKIYMAKLISNGKKQSGWLFEASPIDFCKGNSSYSHPTLSADGEIMIFASDLEGSVGGMDLYITRHESNNWSSPENLGEIINTSGNEFFPFLDSENNLFFSSDGLPGFGGYDVFTCRFNGEAWDKPINLSRRINSENDDIAFSINKINGKTAFYTTRQKSVKSDMQLFKVVINKEFEDFSQLTISYIFHGKPVLKTGLISTSIDSIVEQFSGELTKTESITELLKKDTDLVPLKYTIIPENKKELHAIDTPESKPTTSEKELATKTEKPVKPVMNDNADDVVYRVQFLSSITPKGKYQIKVNSKKYDTFEYYYLGEYRYTVGEFSTFAPAVEFQRTCRRSGFPQAFIVAFKNNVRSTDPSLFK